MQIIYGFFSAVKDELTELLKKNGKWDLIQLFLGEI
ncbi:hypothetical protein SAMN04490243_0759 [Robiginitalea myxolifaciens]|uniref:Uncharacterized protein n=1 Tax=Robiginitalea myxolifaciens TaxID=400055 RepID=A0A1I6FVK6_9FLAO|nr:hypothetical protein SAMN04490243_0759 [Robiginitalea myxolifaciens]